METLNDQYAGKRVLVTGGAGGIGTNLSRRLSELEAKEVIVLDDLSSAYEWNIPRAANITFVKGSILDDEIQKHVWSKKPEVVFHLAAFFANQNSVDHPQRDLATNGVGILKTLQYAQLSGGVERFVYSSSGCGVYGLESKMPFEEHDISISLHTPYQVTKLLGELYTNYFHNMYDLPIANARFFNSFGPGEVPGRYRNVIPNFTYWAMNGRPLPITGDGSETRDWTYVGDIVNGLLAMGYRDEAIGESMNLGTGKETTVLEMATLVNKLTGNPSGIEFKERRNWDKKNHILASIDKARKLIGYAPQTSFAEGVENVYRWFTANRENIWKSAEF